MSSNDEPDSESPVRVGQWLLEARWENLVLTYRPSAEGGRIGCQFVANLENAEGQWKVSSLSFQYGKVGA